MRDESPASSPVQSIRYTYILHVAVGKLLIILYHLVVSGSGVSLIDTHTPDVVISSLS